MSTKTKDLIVATDTGLSDEARDGVSNTLNTVLADLHMIYVKTRNYHWNVTGIHFLSLHELFETQYDALKEAADEIAERVRMYGMPTIGTMQEFINKSRLAESPGTIPDAQGMIENLLKDHETIARNLRMDIERCAEDFEDEATADLLTGLLQKHLEMAWMLRSHLA